MPHSTLGATSLRQQQKALTPRTFCFGKHPRPKDVDRLKQDTKLRILRVANTSGMGSQFAPSKLKPISSLTTDLPTMQQLALHKKVITCNATYYSSNVSRLTYTERLYNF